MHVWFFYRHGNEEPKMTSTQTTVTSAREIHIVAREGVNKWGWPTLVTACGRSLTQHLPGTEAATCPKCIAKAGR